MRPGSEERRQQLLAMIEQAGMSRREFAESVGISKGHMVKILLGTQPTKAVHVNAAKWAMLKAGYSVEEKRG